MLIVVGSGPFPRVDVLVKFPLLFVDERLCVQGTPLQDVLDKVKFPVGPLRCQGHRKVLVQEIRAGKPQRSECSKIRTMMAILIRLKIYAK